jgi:hypothetical protein
MKRVPERPPSRHLDFHVLREALGLPGCPLCRLAYRAARRWLESLFYEQVNDVPTRAMLRASGGFCARHSRMAAHLGNPLGWSIIGADLVSAAAHELRAKPSAMCPVCEVEREAAAGSVRTLLQHIGEEDFAAAYRAGEGLCLPHLRQALAGRRTPERDILEGIERERMQELREQLRGFVAHSDYLRGRDGYATEESDAWLRAARKLGGTYFEVDEPDGA